MDRQDTRAPFAPVVLDTAGGRPVLPADLPPALRPGPGGLVARFAMAIERTLDEARTDLADGAAAPILAAVFALGAAVYFALPAEPWLPAILALALAATFVALLRRRAGHAALATIAFAVLAWGVAAAALETRRVAAPRLDHGRTVAVEGRVVDLDATAKGGLRLGVAVDRMEGRGLAAADTPTAITVTRTLPGPAPAIGATIAFKARLEPPRGPVLPGGYDFARRAWFDGRGASGYMLGRERTIAGAPPTLAGRMLAAIGDLRHVVAERVRAQLPGASGTIAAALMVGEQRAIPESAAEPLRASGLTHIVSISGLHMSLVAGGVMVALRLLLALIPGVALRFPAKKWAAAAALAAVTVYLFLSGMQVAALRSHLMLSVALLAVMVDRPAITLHTVAVAAMAILVVTPSSALDPSFQMSFLAVIALVASWDLWQRRVAARPPPADGAGLLARGLRSAIAHAEGLAFSSLIAGLATAPVIAGIFFRGAPYSILANMIVLPVTGLVIMPAAIGAALAMPFGLDGLPLAVMGLGIDVMVAVGRWTAALPGGAGLLGAPHPATMGLGILAVLWLSLWRTRIRLLGLVPALAACVLVFHGSRPDAIVGRSGAAVAVRAADGRLAVLAGSADRFDVGIWLSADADPRASTDGGLSRGWRCDRLGCVFRRSAPDEAGRTAGSMAGSAPPGGPTTAVAPSGIPPGPPTAGLASTALGGIAAPTVAPPGPTPDFVVAVVRDARAFAEDCRIADVVISRLTAPPGCATRAVVVDAAALARQGATALFVSRAAAPATSVEPREGRGRATVVALPDPSVDESAGARPLDDEAPLSAADPSPSPAETSVAIDAERRDDGDDGDDTVLGRGIAVRVIASLPNPARPWTPRDPATESRRTDDPP